MPCGTPTSSVSPGSVASVASTGKVSKRGRPRKDVQPPSFDDFPVTGTAEEQKHWLKVKNTAYWQYAKLSSPHGEDYRKNQLGCRSTRRKRIKICGKAAMVIRRSQYLSMTQMLLKAGQKKSKSKTK